MRHPRRVVLWGGGGVLLLLALVAHFPEQGGAGAQEPAPPNGDALYQQFCVRCHDADGRGSRGRRNFPDIPDFAQSAWHARRGEARLMTAILDGKNGDMPAFRGRLNQTQARALVAHLRTLDPQADPTATEETRMDLVQQLRQFRAEMRELQKRFDALAAQARKQATESVEEASKARDSSAPPSPPDLSRPANGAPADEAD